MHQVLHDMTLSFPTGRASDLVGVGGSRGGTGGRATSRSWPFSPTARPHHAGAPVAARQALLGMPFVHEMFRTRDDPAPRLASAAQVGAESRVPHSSPAEDGRRQRRFLQKRLQPRHEARRLWKECVSACRSRSPPYQSKNKNKKQK